MAFLSDRIGTRGIPVNTSTDRGIEQLRQAWAADSYLLEDSAENGDPGLSNIFAKASASGRAAVVISSVSRDVTGESRAPSPL
jgi:hypothetical protein